MKARICERPEFALVSMDSDARMPVPGESPARSEQSWRSASPAPSNLSHGSEAYSEALSQAMNEVGRLRRVQREENERRKLEERRMKEQARERERARREQARQQELARRQKENEKKAEARAAKEAATNELRQKKKEEREQFREEAARRTQQKREERELARERKREEDAVKEKKREERKRAMEEKHAMEEEKREAKRMKRLEDSLLSDKEEESKRQSKLEAFASKTELKLMPFNNCIEDLVLLALLPQFQGVMCSFLKSTDRMKEATRFTENEHNHPRLCSERTMMSNWHESRKALEFAKITAVPMFEDYDMRVLSTDTSAECSCKISPNYTSKLMSFMQHTTSASEMWFVPGHVVSEAWLPQFSYDKRSNELFAGLKGGPVGCEPWQFFVLSETDIFNTSTDLLSLVTYVASFLNNKNERKTYCPGVNTAASELCYSQHRKRLLSARYVSQCNFQLRHEKRGRDINLDLDSHLSEKLKEFRKTNEIIAKTNEYVSELSGGTFIDIIEEEQEVVLQDVFSLFMHSEVVEGIRDGERVLIRVDSLIVKPLIAGIDFGVALIDMERQLGVQFATCLRSVLHHMSLCLHGQVFRESLFETTTNINFVSLTSPQNLPLAVHRFAADQRITDIHWGFMRLDLKRDSKLYMEYLQLLYLTRLDHFQQVYEGTKRDSSLKVDACRTPPKYVHADSNLHVHYRSVSEEDLQALQKDFIDSIVGNSADSVERMQQSWEDEIQAWKDNLLSDGEGQYYLPAGGMLMHHGFLMKINIAAFDFMTNPKTKELRPVLQMPQPVSISQALRTYIMKFLEQSDPCECFWTDDEMIPDEKFLISKSSSLQPVVMKIATLYSQKIQHDQFLNDNSIKEREDVMQLLGQRKNTMMQLLKNVQASCRTEKLSASFFNTFKFVVKDVLWSMNNAELPILQMTSLAISDLSRQQVDRASEYITELNSMEEALQGQGEHGMQANVDNIVANLKRTYVQKLDLQLSWSNTLMLDLYTSAALRLGMHKGTYGQMLYLSDAGKTVSVRTQRDKQVVDEWFDAKSAGAGADTLLNLWRNIMHAYWLHVTSNPHVRRMAGEPFTRDEKKNFVSAMSIASMSSVQIDMNGDIDPTCNDWKRSAGTLIGMLEMGKTKPKEQMQLCATFENNLPNSGQGDDTCSRETMWNTTRNMNALSLLRFGPLNVQVACGNVNFGGFWPPSTDLGGRRRIVNSPNVDGSVGLLTDSNMVLDAWEERQVKEISQFGREEAHSSLLMTLVNEMLRRMVPFTERAMTMSVCLSSYNWALLKDNLLVWVEGLTRGLRRHEMQVDFETFKRIWNGPAYGSTIVPRYIESVCYASMRRAIQSAKVSSTDKYIIQLESGFLNVMLNIHKGAISINHVFDGLFLWLSQCAINTNVMAFTCVNLAMLNWTAYCPLLVIAKKLRKIPLDDSEQMQLDLLAKWALPRVTKPSNGQHERHCVKMGAFNPLSEQTLAGWNNKSVLEQARDCIADSIDTVYLGSEQVFQQQYHAFLHSRSMIKAYDKAYGFEEQAAHIWASAQSTKASQCRRENDNVKTLQDAEYLWRTAVAGVRIPVNKMSEGKDNQHETVFVPPYLTGRYYLDVIKEAGCMNGPIKSFLSYCGMYSTHVSRLDIFRCLFDEHLTAYNSKNPRNPRKFQQNAHWKMPILSMVDGELQNRLPVFRMGFQPAGHDKETFNVEARMGVDVLWAIVGQGLFCKEWRGMENDKLIAGSKISIHLRNNGHAAVELLSMMLHNNIPVASVPAGGLVLMTPEICSTNKKQSPVVLKLCREMHADCTGVCLSHNAINMNARRSNQFRMLSFEDGQSLACSVHLTNNTENGCRFVEELPVYPPESVMHMTQHHEVLMQAVTSFVRSSGTQNYDMLKAVQTYGLSVEGKSMTYLEARLTDTAVSDLKEVPLFCWQENQRMVIQVRDDTFSVHLTPQARPHDYGRNSVTDLSADLCSCKFCSEQSQNYPLSYLSFFLTEGTKLCSETIRFALPAYCEARCEHASDADSELTWCFWPVLLWDHLVIVDPTERLVSIWQTPDAVTEESDAESDVGEKRVSLMHTRKLYDAQNPLVIRCPEMLCRLREIYKLEWSDSMRYTVEFVNDNEELTAVKVWVTVHGLEDDEMDTYFFMNNIAEFKNAFLGGNFEELVSTWTQREWLVCSANQMASSHHSRMRFSTIHQDDSDNLTCRFRISDDAMMIDTVACLFAESQQLHKELIRLERESFEERGESSEYEERIARKRRLHELGERKDALLRTMAFETQFVTFYLGKEMQLHIVGGDDTETEHVTLGMIKPNANGFYLQDGLYNVEFFKSDEEAYQRFRLDFMEVSKFMVREGDPLWLRLDKQLYVSIENSSFEQMEHQKMSGFVGTGAFNSNIKDAADFSCWMEDSSISRLREAFWRADTEDDPHMWLRVFYVLSPTTAGDAIEPVLQKICVLVQVNDSRKKTFRKMIVPMYAWCVEKSEHVSLLSLREPAMALNSLTCWYGESDRVERKASHESPPLIVFVE